MSGAVCSGFSQLVPNESNMKEIEALADALTESLKK